jgi:hypothetical chaperone protein
MSLRVGIDFGTSNSGVALARGGEVRVLPLDRANLAPEVVKTILYLTRDNQAFIGQQAVELYYQHNVGRARRFVKKRVGEIEYRGADLFYVTDVYAYVDENASGRLLQYLKTALRSPGYEGTFIFERFYTPGQLAAVYLGALKRRAEEELGQSITAVTLGRPVHFSSDPLRDRQAEDTLRQAAHEAGFGAVSFELEPVAAALDYEHRLTRPETALIFDFGGGTLDITIMRLGQAGRREILANGGVDIAGSDFDRAIIRRRMLPHFGLGLIEGEPAVLELIHSLEDWMALPELSTPLNRRRLQQAAQSGLAPLQLRALESLIFNDLAFSFYRAVEAGKIALSEQGATVINLKEPGIDLWELYTRRQFEQDIHPYLAGVRQVVADTLISAGLPPARIDTVVTTGGSSGIPLFRRMLGEMFGAERIKSSDAFNSVVAGLALKAAEENHPGLV